MFVSMTHNVGADSERAKDANRCFLGARSFDTRWLTVVGDSGTRLWRGEVNYFEQIKLVFNTVSVLKLLNLFAAVMSFVGGRICQEKA